MAVYIPVDITPPSMLAVTFAEMWRKLKTQHGLIERGRRLGFRTTSLLLADVAGIVVSSKMVSFVPSLKLLVFVQLNFQLNESQLSIKGHFQ